MAQVAKSGHNFGGVGVLLSALRSHLPRSEGRRTEWCSRGSMNGLGYSWTEELYKCYVDHLCASKKNAAHPAGQEEAAPSHYLGH